MPSPRPPTAPPDDPAPRFAAREADWRCGPLVYQVLVDRFAPAADLDAKRHHYAPPRRLRGWEDPPSRGHELKGEGIWSHELDFWGGDLQSLTRELSWISDLGMDVVYLNPIHDALTNHKYDARDLGAIAPEYGSWADVRALADATHKRGMRLVLDGVFNHVGRTSTWFQDAQGDARSPRRAFFKFGAGHPQGYAAWRDIANLPELNVEHPEVARLIYEGRGSIVRRALSEGVDGWRLDVASDLGKEILGRLTEAAHQQRPDSLVVGEIWSYPEGWAPPLDGILNFHAWHIVVGLLEGQLDGPLAGRLLATMIDDAGLEPLLRSWLILDNHDMRRLKTALPRTWQQRMAQGLQMTLPGAPCIYYGAELGQEGGDDPENRGPMRWDLARAGTDTLTSFKALVALRKGSRALRIGDFRLLEAARVLAFQRTTDRVEDTRIVVANPTPDPVRALLPLRDGRLINETPMRCLLSGAEGRCIAGMLGVDIPKRSFRVFAPIVQRGSGYSAYKRLR